MPDDKMRELIKDSGSFELTCIKLSLVISKILHAMANEIEKNKITNSSNFQQYLETKISDSNPNITQRDRIYDQVFEAVEEAMKVRPNYAQCIQQHNVLTIHPDGQSGVTLEYV
jgi:hypothetical protein